MTLVILGLVLSKAVKNISQRWIFSTRIVNTKRQHTIPPQWKRYYYMWDRCVKFAAMTRVEENSQRRSYNIFRLRVFFWWNKHEKHEFILKNGLKSERNVGKWNTDNDQLPKRQNLSLLVNCIFWPVTTWDLFVPSFHFWKEILVNFRWNARLSPNGRWIFLPFEKSFWSTLKNLWIIIIIRTAQIWRNETKYWITCMKNVKCCQENFNIERMWFRKVIKMFPNLSTKV